MVYTFMFSFGFTTGMHFAFLYGDLDFKIPDDALVLLAVLSGDAR